MYQFLVCLLVAFSVPLHAEIHELTLEEAVRRTIAQSPEIILARLDVEQAEARYRQARDPFTIKFIVGSGLAYTSGFPLSVEGSAPSILQARAIRSLVDRPLTHRIAQQKQQIRTAEISSEKQREEVVARVAALWLDAHALRRLEDLAQARPRRLETSVDWTKARVEEGLLLPIEARRAELLLAQARHEARVAASDRRQVEAALATVLAYPLQDRVAAQGSPDSASLAYRTPEEAIDAAIASSPELRRLDSAMAAVDRLLQSVRAARLPKVDLIAQYALLGRFNNYADFFNRFERHNYQIGASFQLPVLTGSGVSAEMTTAIAELGILRVAQEQERSRLALEIRRLYSELEEITGAAEVARLDLSIANEDIDVAQARFDEGRLPLRDLETLRYAAAQKAAALEQILLARRKLELELMKETGGLSSILLAP